MSRTNLNGKPVASPLFSRVLSPGQRITHRGLWIYFGRDRERVCDHLLSAGKLSFAAFPDRLELHQLNGEGAVKVIGRALIGADGRISVNGRILEDKNGPVFCRTAKPYRHISADQLFPAFGAVKKTNYFDADNNRATIIHDKRVFRLPTDPRAKYGPAVREQRIIAQIDRDRITFYERDAAGTEEYIGALELTGLTGENISVAEHLEEFALKDLPVHLYMGNCQVEHRGVVFLFSADVTNLYYLDLLAGQLFLRVGYHNRIEVVKKEQAAETIIGAIPIKYGREIAISNRRHLKLDQPGRKHYLAVARLIEELSGREVPVNSHGRLKAVGARVYNLHLYFPMRAGSTYRPAIEAGQMVFRVYHQKILVGLREGRKFLELGRLEFTSAGKLLAADGRPFSYQGQPVMKQDRRQIYLNLEKLIPALGKMEKTAAPGKGIMYREIRFLFDLQPGDLYFPDLIAGQLVLRMVGSRLEVFADREEGKEYIGDFALDRAGLLLTQAGKVYNTSTGPVRIGSRRDVRITKLVRALKVTKEDAAEIMQLLLDKSYDGLHDVYSNGQAREWLKLTALVGKGYLSLSHVDEVLAAKFLYSLADGLEYLATSRQISADLKTVLNAEIMGVMARALENPSLKRIYDSLLIQYIRGSVAAAQVQASDLTTIAQREQSVG